MAEVDPNAVNDMWARKLLADQMVRNRAAAAIIAKATSGASLGANPLTPASTFTRSAPGKMEIQVPADGDISGVAMDRGSPGVEAPDGWNFAGPEIPGMPVPRAPGVAPSEAADSFAGIPFIPRGNVKPPEVRAHPGGLLDALGGKAEIAEPDVAAALSPRIARGGVFVPEPSPPMPSIAATRNRAPVSPEGVERAKTATSFNNPLSPAASARVAAELRASIEADKATALQNAAKNKNHNYYGFGPVDTTTPLGTPSNPTMYNGALGRMPHSNAEAKRFGAMAALNQADRDAEAARIAARDANWAQHKPKHDARLAEERILAKDHDATQASLNKQATTMELEAMQEADPAVRDQRLKAAQALRDAGPVNAMRNLAALKRASAPATQALAGKQAERNEAYRDSIRRREITKELQRNGAAGAAALAAEAGRPGGPNSFLLPGGVGRPQDLVVPGSAPQTPLRVAPVALPGGGAVAPQTAPAPQGGVVNPTTPADPFASSYGRGAAAALGQPSGIGAPQVARPVQEAAVTGTPSLGAPQPPRAAPGGVAGDIPLTAVSGGLIAPGTQGVPQVAMPGFQQVDPRIAVFSPAAGAAAVEGAKSFNAPLAQAYDSAQRANALRDQSQRVENVGLATNIGTRDTAAANAAVEMARIAALERQAALAAAAGQSQRAQELMLKAEELKQNGINSQMAPILAGVQSGAIPYDEAMGMIQAIRGGATPPIPSGGNGSFGPTSGPAGEANPYRDQALAMKEWHSGRIGQYGNKEMERINETINVNIGPEQNTSGRRRKFINAAVGEGYPEAMAARWYDKHPGGFGSNSIIPSWLNDVMPQVVWNSSDARPFTP